MKPATDLTLIVCCCLMVASSALSSAVAVSVPERQVIPVSAATPAAVQVANDDAIDVVSEATTAEAQEAIEPEAVSLAIDAAPPTSMKPDEWSNAAIPHAPAPPLAPASVSVQAAVPGPTYSQGRYAITSQPVYGGPFGRRVVGYRQVWAWQGASYRYQRPVYYRYSNCANGRCN